MSATDKVFVITGASSGLGRSLAIRAGQLGARVALLARRGTALNEVGEMIIADGGRSLALPTDVGDPESVRKAFREIRSQWQAIDILFNNAGIVEPLGALIESSDEALLESLTTNVYGIYLTTREALRIMVEQRGGGTIVNITSGAGRNPYSHWSAYCSQKAAINMFTKCIALEVADRPIRVAAVAPGVFESQMQRMIRGTDRGKFPWREKFVRMYEQGQLALPESVARILIDISLTDWPELSGMVADLRSTSFKKQCREHGVIVPGD